MDQKMNSLNHSMGHVIKTPSNYNSRNDNGKYE